MKLFLCILLGILTTYAVISSRLILENRVIFEQNFHILLLKKKKKNCIFEHKAEAVRQYFFYNNLLIWYAFI